MNKKKLVREQLESTLQRFGPTSRITCPHKGWIRAIRDALGMTAKQLARRMGIAQQAVARIEKDELVGSVTIKTMQRVAECLDCSFVYGFVPRSNLDATLRRQAHTVASKRLTQATRQWLLKLNRSVQMKTNEFSPKWSTSLLTLSPQIYGMSHDRVRIPRRSDAH